MKKISKNFYIIIGVAIVVFILIMFFLQNQNLGSSILNPFSKAQKEAAPAKSGTPSVEASLSYGEALKLYQGRTLQFGLSNMGGCAVNPSSVALKIGVKAMLDNRMGKDIKVYLDGTAYTIKAYSFKIVTLATSAPLPHTIKVDCETGKNNGQIILGQ